MGSIGHAAEGPVEVLRCWYHVCKVLQCITRSGLKHENNPSPIKRPRAALSRKSVPYTIDCPYTLSTLYAYVLFASVTARSARLYRLRSPIRLARVHLLARLLDLLEHSRVVDARFGDNVRGLLVERDVKGLDTCIVASVRTVADVAIAVRKRLELTVKLLEYALDCAGAAAAGHGDVEVVGVVGHCGVGYWRRILFCSTERRGLWRLSL